MRSYLLVSTIVFDLLTVVQVVRLVLRWPVVVAGVSVPLWASAIAAVVVGALAGLGMRLLVKSREAAPGV
jgi:uncharacterized protein YqfA (UPF0365 family)